MTLQEARAPLVSFQSLPVGLVKHTLSCHGAWNSKDARFEKCFLPIISLLPGIIAIIVLFTRVLHPLIGKRFSWLRPFVVEYDENNKVLVLDSKKRFSSQTITLLLLSNTGLTLELVVLLYPKPRFTALLPAISWVCGLRL